MRAYLIMSPKTRNRPSRKDGDRILNKAEDFFTVYWELLALSKFELFTTSSLYYGKPISFTKVKLTPSFSSSFDSDFLMFEILVQHGAYQFHK